MQASSRPVVIRAPGRPKISSILGLTRPHRVSTDCGRPPLRAFRHPREGGDPECPEAERAALDACLRKHDGAPINRVPAKAGTQASHPHTPSHGPLPTQGCGQRERSARSSSRAENWEKSRFCETNPISDKYLKLCVNYRRLAFKGEFSQPRPRRRRRLGLPSPSPSSAAATCLGAGKVTSWVR